MSKPTSSRYAESGVDIDKGNDFITAIKPFVTSTFRRGVLTDIGGFGGLFALGGDRYKDPVLVSGTDGVGTKLLIANKCNVHNTIGIDLVAMCVNDIVVSGAMPLFFLDYFAVGKLETGVALEVVKGIAKGCEISKCSLIGGETAEMPGMYQDGHYDLAGFVVGVAERDKIIGLSSSGVHSNGFSLVRKICFEELGLDVDDYIDELGCTLGEELIKPTRIYTEPLLNLFKNYKVRGLVHITGGGFDDNIPRVLPRGCKAIINAGSWPIQPIFKFLEEKGNVPASEMRRTFNYGIGMALVIDANVVEDAMQQLIALGESPHLIGEVAVRDEDEESVQFV
jgi:phosphoribosylformylglycinamidine cyclo-ligase